MGIADWQVLSYQEHIKFLQKIFVLILGEC